MNLLRRNIPHLASSVDLGSSSRLTSIYGGEVIKCMCGHLRVNLLRRNVPQLVCQSGPSLPNLFETCSQYRIAITF